MKSIAQLLFLITVFFSFAACDKKNDLPFNQKGKAPVLTASSDAVAPAPSDSNNTALTLSWTFPNYATDSANVKYTVEIDSTGKSFSKGYTRIVTKDLSASFTAKELNTILLSYGYAFNVPVDMDVRVTSSYANNNERIASNVLVIKMTPYKIPPIIPLPASGRLFIVGDASDFGWTNDAAPPFPAARELTHISETVWEGIFNMKGSGGYKLLQTQGNWDTQFHFTGGTADAGTFEQKNSDPAFPSPAVAGAYLIAFDFQTGKFTTTKVDNPAPTDLYITGDATPSSWTNTPPVAQMFTPVTNGVFEITMAFTGSGYYKFLSSSGNWQPQFGGSSATGGDLGANWGGGSDPNSVPAPADAGNYKIQVNFITQSYTVTKL